MFLRKKKRVPIKFGNIFEIFKERKVFLILLVIILLGSGVGYSLLINEDKSEIKVEKAVAPTNTVTVEDAFSGKGEFVCSLEKDGVSAKYKIKDKNLYIETSSDNVNTTVIVKDGFTYTQLDEKWAKVKTLSETIVPGSGKYPFGEDLKIECEKKKVEDKLFEIDEGKII